MPQNQTFHSIVLLSGGTALAQLIGICALPFVTRLFTPAEIGVVSLFLSYLGFWINTIAFRYDQALLIASDDIESHALHRLAIILVVLMSLLSAPVLWLLQHNSIFEFQLLPLWTPLITFPILLGSGLSAVYRSWALRAGLLRDISHATVIRSSALNGTKLGLGIFGGGIVGLLAAELVASFVSVARLMQATRVYFAGSKPHYIYFECMRQVGAKYIKFPKLEMPSAWLDAMAMLLPLPLVSGLYGVEAAGWFGLARMVVGLPNAQIGAAVADVFQMKLAQSVRENDQQRAKDLFYALLKKMSGFGLIPLLVTVIVSPWAFPYIFGSSWGSAGIIAAILSPWLYAAFIVSPLSRALSVLQAQEWKLFYDITALGMMVTCYFLAKTLILTLNEFCLLISVTQAFCYFVYAIVLYLRIESRFNKTSN